MSERIKNHDPIEIKDFIKRPFKTIGIVIESNSRFFYYYLVESSSYLLEHTNSLIIKRMIIIYLIIYLEVCY